MENKNAGSLQSPDMDFDALLKSWPQYEDLGAYALVPVSCRHVSSPRVLWTNARLFATRGIDVTDSTVRELLTRWLIDNFAVHIPYPPDDPCSDYDSSESILYADLYGNTGGMLHGGSGRCGAIGGIHAKGIGRTPLVSPNSDWFHSHGCMWLEETVREVICSEIVDLELTTGAARTLAIIDSGTRVHWGNGEQGARRAILVRPNFVRLAHLQRSIFFGSSGTSQSDQAKDALRVIDTVEALWGIANKRDKLGVCSKDITESAARVASQVGLCAFYRLWPGPFYSSNCSIDGAIVDFGSFRSLASWERFYGDQFAPGFGDELSALVATFLSLLEDLSRQGIECPKENDLVLLIYKTVYSTFRSECLRAANLQCDIDGGKSSELQELLVSCFESQQSSEVTLDRSVDNLSDYFVPPQFKQLPARQKLFHSTLLNLLREHYRSSTKVQRDVLLSMRSLQRIFYRRSLLEREALLGRAKRFAASDLFGRGDFPALVHRFIARTIARSRRVWKDLPTHLIVCAQDCDELSSWALCFDIQLDVRRIWIEASRIGAFVYLIGNRYPYETAGVADYSTEPHVARYLLGIQVDEKGRDTISFNDQVVRVPSPPFRYAYD